MVLQAEKGTRQLFDDFINLMSVKNRAQPNLMIMKLKEIRQAIEDTYSVSGDTETQEAIDDITTDAGTIFIEAGTHVITTAIDLDSGGSIVIYGHGDNTILTPDDTISVFNITDQVSLTLKNLKLDLSNYTGDTRGILINEGSNNKITLENVTIIGNGTNGIGIEIQSNNITIKDCDISLLNHGVYINGGDYNRIYGNVIDLCASYGIYLDSVSHNSIYDNTYSNNLQGIYLSSATDNNITRNLITLNTENGMFLTASSSNNISNNTIDGNDSNTVNPQAGVYIDANSDSNILISNIITDNNNSGIGTTYGIYIGNANCNKNIIDDNHYSGNDATILDNGTNTGLIYYCFSESDINNALTSIGNKSGLIKIVSGTIALSGKINIDGGGDYKIEGEGKTTVINCNGDRTAFDITSANSCILKDFKIDSADVSSSATEIITIDEGSNNRIILENIEIIGDADLEGNGIVIKSDKCIVKDCYLINLHYGIRVHNGDKFKLINNYVDKCGEHTIRINSSVEGIIIGNHIYNSNNEGIHIRNNSHYTTVIGNILGDNANSITINSSDYCTINGNFIESVGGDTGIGLTSVNYITINGNTITSDGSMCILINTANYITITGNSIFANGGDGIEATTLTSSVITGNMIKGISHANASDYEGIKITTNCDYNTISGNTIVDFKNTGAGDGIGISIENGNDDDNTIVGNTILNNDIPINDNGTNTLSANNNTV